MFTDNADAAHENIDNAYLLVVVLATIIDIESLFRYEIREPTLAGHRIPNFQYLRNCPSKWALVFFKTVTMAAILVLCNELHKSLTLKNIVLLHIKTQININYIMLI